MSIIEQGIVGGFSGKTGPVVGARVRGKDTMRALPRKSSKPRSRAQLIRQSRFKVGIGFITRAQSIFKIGYQQNKVLMTPANKAFQHIDRDAIIGEYPDFKINYAKVQWTDESRYQALQGMMNPLVTPLPMYEVKLEWELFGGGTDSTNEIDKAVILFYSPVHRMFISEMDVTRGMKSATIPLPTIFAGSEIHGWAFFVSEDGTKLSPTAYLGLIELKA